MPLVAVIFITNYGWRYASILIGIIGLLFITGSGQLIRRDPSQMGQLPDGGRTPAVGQPDESKSGISFQEALRNGQFRMVCIITFLVECCLLTIMIHIVPHATDIGIEPIKAAGVLSTVGGVSMLGRISTGIAIDRIGIKKSLIMCLILLIGSFFWLQVAIEMWMLYLFAVVYGVAHGSFFTVISPMVAELFGIGSHGVLLGIVVFSGTAGGAIGPILGGYIFDITSSYQLVFMMLAGVSIVSLLLTLFLKPAISKE
jgi:predicted MFS family arabinose efflux permease